MKKIILLTLISFLLASTSFAGIVITAKLEIGKKSQPNCPGFGFCSFTISVSYEEGSVNGNLGVDNQTGIMTVGISEADILKVQPDKIIYFKGKNSVTFTEGFTMSAEIKNATKASRNLEIKAGEYPLTYKNGMYYIEIPF